MSFIRWLILFIKNGARCSNAHGSGRKGSSIQPDHDRTIDREAGTAEWSAARTRKQSVLYECQDVELFAKLPSIAAVDRGLRPFV
jgi:hypothetical protein